MESDQTKIETESQEVTTPTNPLDKGVGTKEPEKLKAVPVVILGVEIKDQTKKDSDKVIGKIAHFLCEHPDKDDPIYISKIKYFKDEDNLAEAGSWYGEDEDGNILKASALAKLMVHYEVATLNSFIGTKVNTIANKAGYLCLKAF